MKLGRNFTNTLIAEVLDEESRRKIISGELDLFSLNAMGLRKFKKDVIGQLDAAKKLSLDWLELDCDVPNPYLDFSDEECKKIRDKADEYGIELSVHLSYSSVGKEVSCIQNYEREKSILIYIWAPFDICAASNRKRFETGTNIDDHIVPESLMKSYYRTDDIEQIFLKDRTGKSFKLRDWDTRIFDNSYTDNHCCYIWIYHRGHYRGYNMEATKEKSKIK